MPPTTSLPRPCAAGTIQPIEGQTSCLKCGLAEYANLITGSTTCNACTSGGMICNDGSMTLAHGWWHNDSLALGPTTEFKHCKYPRVCSAYRNGSLSVMNCTHGTKGVMCASCEVGYVQQAGGACTACNLDPALKTLCLVLLCAAGLAILIKMSDLAQHPGDTLGNPFKCYVDYLQMLSTLSR